MPIDLPVWLRPALPFAVTGTAYVIAGGLVAAATAPTPSEHASWAAAYLVLVAGVTQVALGVGQSLLATPSRHAVVGEFVAWNVGNVAVLAGTMAGVTPAVDVGGILLVVALVLWISAVRGVRPASGWGLHLYRLLVGLMLVSIPIGLLLAQARA